MFRRLRSAVILAVIWATVWLPVGAIVGYVLTRIVTPGQSLRDFLAGLIIWTMLGSLSGGIFALLLSLFERSRTIHELTAWRLAAWGTIGGGGLPLAAAFAFTRLVPSVHMSSSAPPVFALMAALGAFCAVGTLWLARREQPTASASVSGRDR